jgi:hypothetical protein
MTQDPHQHSFSEDDADLDSLFAQRELGGEIFVARTVEAIRGDRARLRRTRRIRNVLTGATALAASVAFMFSLGPGGAIDREVSGSFYAPVSDAEAALYGEMAALEDLLGQADVLANEESRQTLDFLIVLTQY